MHNVETGTDLIIISSHPYNAEEVRTTTVMKVFAEKKRVYFFESPIFGVSESTTYFMKKEDNGITIIQPYLPKEVSIFERKDLLVGLLKELIIDENITHYTVWTDTPKAMPLMRSLNAEIIIYDCLHDYSQSHHELEKELFEYADVVLTSGMAGHHLPQEKTQDAFLASDFRLFRSPNDYIGQNYLHNM